MTAASGAAVPVDEIGVGSVLEQAPDAGGSSVLRREPQGMKSVFVVHPRRPEFLASISW